LIVVALKIDDLFTDSSKETPERRRKVTTNHEILKERNAVYVENSTGRSPKEKKRNISSQRSKEGLRV
jgi:hypothetical protein